MALEHSINEDAFSALPEAVQAHYEKQGDSYFLQAVGMTPKAKVDEFRQNNIDLKKQLETKDSEITDLNEKLKKASTGVDEDKLKTLVEDGVNKRVKEMKTEYETQLQAVTGERDTVRDNLNKLVINDVVTREAVSAGVHETALDDVLTRANRVFKVVEGKATAFDGDDVLYGKDGTTPLTVKDWLAGQAAVAPHLFKPSDGSGAKNENKGGGADRKGTLTSVQKIAQGLKEL